MKKTVRILTKGRIVLVTAAIVLTMMYSGCDALGASKQGLLDSVEAVWSSGIRTGVTIEGQTADTAFIAVFKDSSFAHFLVRDNAGILEVKGGNRGTIVTIDNEFITLSIQQEYDSGLGQWVPASQLLVERYLLDADTLFIVPDINNDLTYDGTTQVLKNGATINLDYDFRVNFTKEPDTLTVTGTIGFEGGSYSGPNDNLGVLMDKTNLGNPDYLSVAPVDNGSTSENYSLNNVKPGLYYLGGVIDLETSGNFDDTEDWLGTFGGIDPFADPPNTLVFSDNTVFDFLLNIPTP